MSFIDFHGFGGLGVKGSGRYLMNISLFLLGKLGKLVRLVLIDFHRFGGLGVKGPGRYLMNISLALLGNSGRGG